ncbi:sodium:solute symporter family transporter [Adhaeretor mobilis]|uniref:Putative symporter YidK n=1 Tax=Adhaeretor mobilis TaxID=1930276 RepID=A0A517MWP6_9BACT|nr:sodium/solute symporter [Adhaeretor mobilis]QDS99298.1 putative symporter YidK [Adhaeretor mobilis]
MHLEILDFVVVAIYFTSLLALGVYSSRQQASQEDYFMAGRNVHWLLAGVSVVATLLSTVSFVALPGEVIRNGIGYFGSMFAFILIIPVVNRIVIPSLMSMPVTSIYDYLEYRFGKSVRTVGAIVFVLIRLIWISLILYTAARAVSPMTGWPIPVLVVIMGLVTVFYTTLGGMKAVLWSDFAQFVILLGGAIWIPCQIALSTGSGPWTWWSTFAESSRAQTPAFSFDPTERTTLVGMILVTFMWNICTHSSDQVAAQRYLCTGSAKEARRSFWAFSIGNIGVIILLMFCGMALFHFRYLADNLPMAEFQVQIASQADNAMPEFIAKHLPAGVTGLILAALLAAAMSSVSSGINSISAVVVTDLMNAPRDVPSQPSSLKFARSLALGTGVIAMLGAVAVEYLMSAVDWNLIDLIERINHLFVAPLGAVFFAGIWFRHVGRVAVLLGFGAGVFTSAAVSFSKWLFQYDVSFMWILPCSFAVSLLVAYAAGFCFDAPSSAQLKVLYQPKSGRQE